MVVRRTALRSPSDNTFRGSISMQRRWEIAETIEVPPELRRALGGHPLLSQIMAQRGWDDPDQALAFLDPSRYTPASPEELPGMVSAVSRLRRALAAKERIRVWGDFDADGVTATALLVETLSSLGANVDYDLPRAGEGHGLSQRAIDDALCAQTKLLLTCDNGVADIEPARYARQWGLDLVITDHHDLPDELPPCQALVDPKQLGADHPLADLAGVGVAWMLALSLCQATDRDCKALDPLLGLVAIGTIADLAPLTADTRYWAQRGLQVLADRMLPGLVALCRAIGRRDPVDAGAVRFQIAPRLNAAARLGDAREVVELLLSRDAARAEELAWRFEALNQDRRARTQAVLGRCHEIISQQSELLHEPALWIEGSGWAPGVLGAVASLLSSEHERPVVLVAGRADGSWVASARSIEGVDIHAAIASAEELVLRQGGHPMAAGFSVMGDNLLATKQRVLSWLRAHAADPESLSQPLPIDALIPWGELSEELARDLARLAPTGPANPEPCLACLDGELVRIADLSQRNDTAHRLLWIDPGSGALSELVWFNAGELPQVGSMIDVACVPTINRHNGQERLQVRLLEWRAAQAVPTQTAALVHGTQVVDWRLRPDSEQALNALRSRLGSDLQVWAEGLDPQPENVVSRLDLQAGVPALAIGVSPASPSMLAELLSRAEPQIIYLLPPLPLPRMAGSEVVKRLATRLSATFAQHVEPPSIAQLASEQATLEDVILVALEGLQAAGRLSFGVTGERLAIERPGRGQPIRDESVMRRARDALCHWQREIDAFRQAYPGLPLTELIVADK